VLLVLIIAIGAMFIVVFSVIVFVAENQARKTNAQEKQRLIRKQKRNPKI